MVWRRTGEICLVAPEFCMLTEWPMEELVGRKKYIYEVNIIGSFHPDSETTNPGSAFTPPLVSICSSSKTNQLSSTGKTLHHMRLKTRPGLCIHIACYSSPMARLSQPPSVFQYEETSSIFPAWLSVRQFRYMDSHFPTDRVPLFYC